MAEEDPEREVEKERELDRGEYGEVEKDRKLDRGGYNKEIPPEDDVCPICFSRFELPCRTSCGHWFCSRCFLQLWSHNNNNKPCKCPMCNHIVTKLVPLSPMPFQLDIRTTLKQVKEYFKSDDRRILKDVEHYNLLYDDGPLSLFQKMQRRLLEDGGDRIRVLVYLALVVLDTLLTLMMVIYTTCDFDFLPRGWMLIAMFPIPICLTIWTLITMDARSYRLMRSINRSDELAGN